MKRRLSYAALALLVLALDQWSKHEVKSFLQPRQRVPVVAGVFDVVHVQNEGGPFSVLHGRAGALRRALLFATSAVALAALLYIGVRAPVDATAVHVGQSLALGGAIGNIVDRFRFGHVVDFLDLHYGRRHWPSFNVADACISVGVAILAYMLLRHPDSVLGKPARD